MSYSNIEKLFIDLIKYNEENIELLGEMQIPITNIYYFSILDQNDSKINSYISYLTDSSNSNPFDNFRNNMSFDEEQICQINIVKSTLKQIDKDHSKADELLPTADGFFFGNTNYDEWYYNDVKNTIKMLEDEMDENGNFYGSYYYRSSW